MLLPEDKPIASHHIHILSDLLECLSRFQAPLSSVECFQLRILQLSNPLLLLRDAYCDHTSYLLRVRWLLAY